MRGLLRRSRFWQGAVLLAADILFFGVTNPSRVVSIMLMLGFLLLTATLYYLYGRLLAVASLYGLSFGRHPRRLALFATAATAGLLALQSIGELSVRDVLVLGPLALILYVYLGYGRSRSAAERRI